MGKEMYIATSPSDILSVYKEARKLDMNPIIAKIMRDFNCSVYIPIQSFMLVAALTALSPSLHSSTLYGSTIHY